MKWFYNLKVGTKLLTGFILVALIAGIVGVVGALNIKKIDSQDTIMYQNMVVPIDTMGMISTSFQRMRANVLEIIVENDTAKMSSWETKANDRFAEIDKLGGEFEKAIISPEMRTMFDQFKQAESDYKATAKRIIDLAKNNKDQEALDIWYGEAEKQRTVVQDLITKISGKKSADAKALSDSNTDLASTSVLVMIILIAAAVIISIFLGLFISSIISKPLNKALQMINEMSMGHLGLRLKMDTKDEVGHMAAAMDVFADSLQNVVIGTMKKISEGDVSLNISARDEKDEIAPALNQTIDSIKNLISEANMLSKAAVEGKLDTRGNAEKFKGGYRQIVEGVNNTLDAVIGPLNVAAEYVDRISKGDIPARITDNYNGDFNEIKNNLNTCIDAVNALVADANMLSVAAVEGKFDTRADDLKHGGDFRKIVNGVNSTLDTVVDKVFWYESLLDAVPFPLSVTDLDMNWTFINKPVENMLNVKRKDVIGKHCSNWNANICKTENCGIAGLKRNKLQTMFEQQGMNFQVDTSYISNMKGEKIGHIEVVQDITARAKGMEYQKVEVERLAANLALMAKGNLELDLNVDAGNEYTKVERENFTKISESLSQVKDALTLLVTDANMLSAAAVEGKLDTRADASKHGGDFAKIVDGVNKTLDSVIGPLNVAAEYVDRISKGDIPARITDNYNGDFNEIKNNINMLIDSINTLISEMQNMSAQHDLGDIDVTVTEGKFEGAYKVMAKGVNDMVNGHINVKKKAMACVAEFAKGNFDAHLEKFPGKKAFINDNMEALRKNLKDVNAEIGQLVNAAIEGRLSTRANADIFQGDWKKLTQGLNTLLEAVIKPVQEAASVLNEMSNGNLQMRVTGNYNGDHAEIKNALNETLDALSNYVDEIANVLTEMANSNMVVEISGDYKGDFAPIKQALNLIIESFNQVLSDINNAADQVAAGSRQVSDGSQALSQGATEQASSIEQLTASITEIAAQTKQNAVSANEANELALTAKNNAADGNVQMKDMLKAMEEINVSSANISKIIKVIDEIAFQTNILALNAAVEAARAGQHGKGFAVVAEEVRNLAARSASAAKETTGMIEGSIKKVETGTKIANETAAALDKIVNDVAKAANLVGTIATASNEQATGIAQVNQGVEQVSMVVQTNSATAEESAAASEELSSQADLLKEMIGKFRLKNGESHTIKSLESGMKKMLSDGGAAKRQALDSKNNRRDAGVRKNAKIALSDGEFGKY